MQPFFSVSMIILVISLIWIEQRRKSIIHKREVKQVKDLNDNFELKMKLRKEIINENKESKSE